MCMSDKADCNISRLFMYFCGRYVDNNHIMPIEDHGSTLKKRFCCINPVSLC